MAAVNETGFAVVRHPHVAALGILPAGALEQQRAQGWYRISDFRTEPSQFHLPEFAGSFVDLDAPPPEPEPEPEPETDETAEPVDEDEEQQ